MTWDPDARLRLHDQPYEDVQTEYERSLSRCVMAVVVTIVTLAIVAVLR